MWVAYKQASSTYLKQNGRTGTLLPYPRRIIPWTRYVVYIMLVPGVWLHPRQLSWGPRDTLSTPQSRSEPNSTCWGTVCVGADCSHSSLPLIPTATSQKKKTKQTEDSAGMHSIEGKNNFNFLNLANSETCRLPSQYLIPEICTHQAK